MQALRDCASSGVIAVVTGSNGFLGSHLADALVASGAEVRVLTRPESRKGTVRSDVKNYVADALDADAVRSSGIWDGSTHVFHAAGRTRGATLEAFRDGNTRPTENLLAAIAARSPAARTILVSSQAAAGPALSADTPVTELDPCCPVDAYGTSKLEAEQVAHRYCSQIPLTILRPAAIFGPRDRDFPRMFREAEKRIGFYPTPVPQRFSAAHVHDVVSAIIGAAHSTRAIGQTYFVANPEHMTWEKVSAMVRELSGKRGVRLRAPAFAFRVAGLAGDIYARLRPGSDPLVTSAKVMLALHEFWLCDSSRLTADIGWKPRLTLQEGLQETYLAYARAHVLRPHPSGGAAETPGGAI